MPPERVLGIDPGSRATGYGCVERRGNRLRFVHAGVIRVPGDMSFARRLERMYAGLAEVIKTCRPTVAAVEDIFHAVNPKSALKLGQARGAAILAAVHGGLEVHEYPALQVKQAVVGYGRAEKAQVQHMVKILLNLSRRPAQDAADALAVAICHAHSAGHHTLVDTGSGRISR